MASSLLRRCEPEIYNVRAVDMVCPEDDFFRFMDLYAAEAVGKV